MKTVDFNAHFNEPIAVALGFFDCIHLGHRALVRAAQTEAREICAKSALLTFKNDIGASLGQERQIYTFEERAVALERMGLDVLIAAQFDEEFKKLPAEEFFEYLIEHFNVKSIFVGQDYTFGAGGAGGVALLSLLCSERGIKLNVMPYERADGQKISTSQLKALVKCGNMQLLNALLGAPYMIKGRIVSNRRVGAKLGYPTANIDMSRNKLPPRDGIYATTITVDGKTYGGMTNIGDKPTFGDSEQTVETYIFDFNGDLYGKDALLEVYERTRDVRRFESPQALVEQLHNDESQIRQILKTIAGGNK